MSVRVRKTAPLLFVAMLAIGGCGQIAGLESVMGPGVRLDAGQAKESAINYLGVRDALLQRAGLPDAPAPGDPRWLIFINAGYGFVDEKCNAFINSLFWYDRQRQSLSKQTTLVGDATRAILGEVNTTAHALNIVAAAFSLTTHSIDNLYGSVLFSMPPATIQTMMMRLRKAHREVVTRDPGPHLAQAQAMTVIADYLAICMPTNIEARIQSTLNETVFISNPDGSVVPSSVRSDANQRAIERAAKNLDDARKLDKDEARRRGVIVDAEKQVFHRTEGPPVDVERARNGRGQIEINLPLRTLFEVQQSLCVAPTGDFGNDQSPTRLAIVMFQEFGSRELKPQFTGIINTPDLMRRIRSSGPCDRSIYRNIYEKRMWSDPQSAPPIYNLWLGKALKALHAERKLAEITKDFLTAVASAKVIGPETRRGLKIIALSMAKPPVPNDELTHRVHLEILRYRQDHDDQFGSFSP